MIAVTTYDCGVIVTDLLLGLSMKARLELCRSNIQNPEVPSKQKKTAAFISFSFFSNYRVQFTWSSGFEANYRDIGAQEFSSTELTPTETDSYRVAES